MRFLANVGGKEFAVELRPRGGGRYTVRLDGRERLVETRAAGDFAILSIDGRDLEAWVGRSEGGTGPGAECGYDVLLAGRHYSVRLADPLRPGGRAADAQARGPVAVRSVMPGKIVAILVEEGQKVSASQGLLVVEAMKMENEIPAPRAGRVTGLRVKAGEAVEAGAVLLGLE